MGDDFGPCVSRVPALEFTTGWTQPIMEEANGKS